MRRASLSVSVVALAAAALLVGSARAEPSAADKATATVLFKEGRALMEKKQYAEACVKLAGSQALDPGGGTLLNLALCHEAEGKTATAWTELHDALAIARNDKRDERVKIAQEHLASVEPRLAKLTVTVPPEAALKGLVVKRDGAVVPDAAWGTPVPADPGDHLIEASAPGKKAWSGHVTVKGDKDVAEARIPKLDDLPAEAPPAASSATPLGSAAPSASAPAPYAPPSPPPKSQGPSSTAYVLGGVGVASLVVAGGFSLAALSKKSKSNDACRGGCTQAGADLSKEAVARADTATIFASMGVVALGAGIITYLVTKPDASATGVRVVPSVGPGTATLGAFGSF